MKTLIEDIKWEIEYYYTKARGILYDLGYGVRNIFEWMPIVWRDRDWDQNYLLLVLEFKFKRMAKLHKEHGHLQRSEHTAKRLRVMAELTSRLLKDEFAKEDIDKQFKYIGPKELGKVLNRKAFSRACKKANNLRKHHKEYLFKLMEKHLDKLWD